VVAWATRYVVTFTILAGALLAGGAAFFGTDVSRPLWPLSIPQVLGLLGTVLIFIGGIYVAFVEDNTAEILENTRKALDQATDFERQSFEIYKELLDYEDAVTRLKSLYTCYSIARGTIEQGLSASLAVDVDLASVCLNNMKTDLKVALGFNLTDFWTVSIYKAVPSAETGSLLLQCVAQDRSIDCDISEARTWPLGVGVGGIALAKNDEVVVPDLADDKVGTAFRLEKSRVKAQDSERYRSMFVVPISAGVDKLPWGVAMATSNQPSHFGGDGRTGVKPEEAVRALAGITALAVEVCRKNSQNGDTTTQDRGALKK